MPDASEKRDRFELRYRNPLARDFVIVSQVVLVGYAGLSDGAKLTYWVIYSHDWYEPARGGRKGYVYPTVGRLAQLRHATPRTIQRHLKELVEAGLLTRELRRGKASLLYIEEPGDEEIGRYLAQQGRGGDIFVGGGVTEMSPHKKEEDKKDKTVNGDEKVLMEERSAGSPGFQPIATLLSSRPPGKASRDRGEWLAQEILSATGDAGSLGCYRTIARSCPQELVFEALALLKEALHNGAVRKSRGALVVGTVRRLCAERGMSDPFRGGKSGRGLGAAATLGAWKGGP